MFWSRKITTTLFVVTSNDEQRWQAKTSLSEAQKLGGSHGNVITSVTLEERVGWFGLFRKTLPNTIYIVVDNTVIGVRKRKVLCGVNNIAYACPILADNAGKRFRRENFGLGFLDGWFKVIPVPVT